MNVKELTVAIKAVQRSLKTWQRGKDNEYTGQPALTGAMLRKLASALEILEAAQHALQHQDMELTTARQQYQQLFDSAPDGYLIADAKGVIQYANHMAAILLALTQDELVGDSLLRHLALESRPLVRTYLTRLRQGGQCREREICLQSHAGTAIPAIVSITPIRDGRGHLLGLRWLLRDIIERRWAQAALSRTNDELEQLVRQRTTELAITNEALQAEITERKRAEEEREQLIQQLQDALSQIKQLHGLLPICAYCKKIRNDQNDWEWLENYISEHSDARFTHGICPECFETVMRAEREAGQPLSD